jgi:acyl-CoA thioesterase
LIKADTAPPKGRKIFQMMVSYSKPEPSPLKYQPVMPSVPLPESLKSDEDKLRELLLNPQAKKYHKSIQMRLEQPIVIETKTIPLKHIPIDEHGKPNKLRMWIKAKGKLPDIAAVHQVLYSN